MIRRGLVAIVAAVIAFELAGQQEPTEPTVQPATAKGLSGESVYAMGTFDTVNTLNGNVGLVIPIQEYHVSSTFSYRFALYYNSKVWDYENDERVVDEGSPYEFIEHFRRAIPERHSNAGAGWTTGFGRLWPARTFNVKLSADGWVYQAADGSEHVFRDRLRAQDSPAPSCSSAPSPCWDALHPSVAYTMDGTYLELREHITAGVTTYTVSFPSGEVHTFDIHGRFIERRDPYNNWLRVTYQKLTGAVWSTTAELDEERWLVTDGTGGVTNRQHIVRLRINPTYTAENYRRIVSGFDLAASAGRVASYELQHEDAYVQSQAGACGDLTPGESDGRFMPLVRVVTGPESWAWTANYYYSTYDQGGPCSAGIVATVNTPTLAKYEWTWTTYVTPQPRCLRLAENGMQAPSAGVATKKVRNGTETPSQWTYSQGSISELVSLAELGTQCDQDAPPNSPPPNLTHVRFYPHVRTEIIGPDGHRDAHYYSTWSFIGASTKGALYTEFGQPFTRHDEEEGDTEFLSTERFECAPSCTRVRRTLIRMEADPPPGNQVLPFARYANPRRTLEKAISRDDTTTEPPPAAGNETWTQTERFDYDDWGHFRVEKRTASWDPDWYRQQSVNWNESTDAYPDIWRAAHFSRSQTTEARTAGTDAYFSTGTREFLLDPAQQIVRTRTWAGAARSESDLVTVFTRGAGGNITMEERFGGDACLPVLPGRTCTRWNVPDADLQDLVPQIDSNAYATAYTWSYGSLATVQPVDVAAAGSPLFGFKTLDCVIDANSGLATSCKDSGGIITGFTYDLLGRLRWTTPANIGNGTPGGDPWTEHVYTAATSTSGPQIDTITYANGGFTELFRETVYFDFLGRPREHRGNVAGQVTKQITEYDVAGRKLRDSLPVLVASSPSAWTTYGNFDAFGRPRTVTPPEGASHAVTFAYDGEQKMRRTAMVATSAGEVPATVTEEYDGAGRLAAVVEPSDTSADGMTKTKYRYDVQGRLDRVQMTDNGVTQPRSFQYDGRGFLLSETHPEDTILYDGYDARGNAQRVRRGGGTVELRNEFDKASRLTAVWSGGRVEKEFRYFATGIANGRLQSSWRNNFDRFGPGTVVQVKEEHEYGGRGGRLSRTTTTVPVPTSLETYYQDYAYTTAGFPVSQQFSLCGGVAACRSASVQNAYTGPTLTGVGTYVSGMTYHPTGAVSTVTHRKADTTSFVDGYPLDAAGRLQKITFGSWDALGPVVSSVTPNHGPLAGGTTVTIRGLRLRNLASVRFGTTFATQVTWVSDTELRAVTPAATLAGKVDVSVTNPDGLAGTLSQSFYYAPPPVMARFWTVTPCRVLDTRNANGPYGGPVLGAGSQRSFTIGGRCGIPATATAIAANVTVVSPAANGFLGFYPGNALFTGATVSGMAAGMTRATQAILALSIDGNATIGVKNDSAGSTHFILDVSGYFAPVGSSKTTVMAAAAGPVAPMAASWDSGVYQYDGAGNIKAIGNETFTYDRLSRLKTAQIPRTQFPAGGEITTQSYSYDGFGNIRSIVSVPAQPTDDSNIQVQTSTNRIEEADWEYDDAGNVTKTGGGLQLAWDAVGTLRQRIDGASRTEVYLYSASDERFATFDITTGYGSARSRRTIRDAGNRVVREITGVGAPGFGETLTWERDWIYRGNAIAASEGLEGRRHYHLDHLGTPRLITDADGVRTAFHTYYPFGGEATVNQDTLRLKFTGHERDFAPPGSVNHLDYMHARYYSPGMGRFLSVDPKRTSARTSVPQTWNRYSYTINNTLKYIDANGEDITLVVRAPGDGITNFGHVAVRVHGKGYDKTYDFGRYGKTWGFMKSKGEGILRVWGNYNAFIAGQKKKGDVITKTWQTSKAFDQAVIDHYGQQIKSGEKTQTTKSFSEYKLDGNYGLLSNNCTTTCMVAVDSAQKETGIKLDGFDKIKDEKDPDDVYDTLRAIEDEKDKK